MSLNGSLDFGVIIRETNLGILERFFAISQSELLLGFLLASSVLLCSVIVIGEITILKALREELLWLYHMYGLVLGLNHALLVAD